MRALDSLHCCFVCCLNCCVCLSYKQAPKTSKRVFDLHSTRARTFGEQFAQNCAHFCESRIVFCGSSCFDASIVRRMFVCLFILLRVESWMQIQISMQIWINSKSKLFVFVVHFFASQISLLCLRLAFIALFVDLSFVSLRVVLLLCIRFYWNYYYYFELLEKYAKLELWNYCLVKLCKFSNLNLASVLRLVFLEISLPRFCDLFSRSSLASSLRRWAQNWRNSDTNFFVSIRVLFVASNIGALFAMSQVAFINALRKPHSGGAWTRLRMRTAIESRTLVANANFESPKTNEVRFFVCKFETQNRGLIKSR